MPLDYSTFDQPYDAFMNRSITPSDSSTYSNTSAMPNTEGATDAPNNSGTGVETATNLNSSQVATSSNTNANGNTETMPIKEGGAVSDLWINTFIKSSNWKPRKQGFWLDGPTGYAEFVNVYVSGTINATTGVIGGFTIGATTISASNFILDSANQRITLGSGNDVVILDADDATYRLWAGNAVPASAPFSVTKAGVLNATGAVISGTITADTGIIGGWIIQTGLLESAASGARVELNSTKSRISIFDVSSEVVVMGYLNGLAKHDGSGNWGAGNYGFWAKTGDMLSIDGDAEYVSGDWVIQNDASYLVNDASNNTIIRLGTDTGEKGLFIYNTSGVQLAKLISDQIFIGNTTESLKYSVAGGLVISDPIIMDTLTTAENINAGAVVMILNDGTVCNANNEVETIPHHYGIAVTTASVSTSIKVQKTGLYTTSGLIPGRFYGAGSGYDTEAITIDPNTGGSFYDANLGVGQSYTTTKLFTTGISLHLSSPLGTGSYAYKLRMYPVFPSEGGPARNLVYDTALSVLSINRSGSTATVVMGAGTTLFPVTDGYVLIAGAVETAYNGWHKITGVSVSGAGATFTYTVSGTPATPATGTITAKFRPFWNTLTGNVSLTGTGDNFIRFNFATNPFEFVAEKMLFEFTATTAGQINIEYSASGGYSGGDLWLAGVVDTGKDLRFRVREAYGAGTLSLLSDTYQATVGSFASGRPTVLGDSGTFPGKYAATAAIGLAKSSTKLLLGYYSRQ